MTKVTESRIAEMDEEMRKWQIAVLDQLLAGENGRPPEPPVFSPEELDTWNTAFRARIEATFVAASGGQAAYDKLNAQTEAKRQARTEADRSVAVVQTSVVEEHLRSAIERYFPGNDSDPNVIDRIFNPMDNWPLGTFAARVDIAFALGIIGAAARSALKKIGEIRNLFAHRVDIHSFDHPAVDRLVEKLTYINFAITGPDAEGLLHVWHRNPNNEVKAGHGYRAVDNPFDPRGKF